MRKPVGEKKRERGFRKGEKRWRKKRKKKTGDMGRGGRKERVGRPVEGEIMSGVNRKMFPV